MLRLKVPAGGQGVLVSWYDKEMNQIDDADVDIDLHNEEFEPAPPVDWKPACFIHPFHIGAKRDFCPGKIYTENTVIYTCKRCPYLER